jgi:lipoprotein-anchoring transpeptidase ErfK/SrfK
MTGPLSRIAVAVLLLTPSALARAETGAYVDVRPTRALRLAAAAPGPEIPGVTYPRQAPPDLVAGEPTAEPHKAEAAAAAPELAPAPVAEPAVPVIATALPVQDAVETPPPAAAAPAPPAITLRLDVDLASQRLTVTERDVVKGVWLISSGRAGTPTKPGTFRPQWASRMWYSRQYDMAPMPHAVFFNGGIAFHATQATHLLGRPASHGCVRLSPQNARALYGMIHAHGYAHTEIVVTGQPQIAATEKRKPKARISGAETGAPFWSFF